MCSTIASILNNSSEDCRFDFYIINSGLNNNTQSKINTFSKSGKCSVNFIYVDKDMFKDCPLTAECKHISIATYYRFKLPDLLPSLDKVLYLDCDINVLTNLKELYNIEVDDKYCALAEDVVTDESMARLGLKEYYNTGVMLANLKKWREDNISVKLFEYAKNNRDKIVWVDQDVINVIMAGKIKRLENRWNAQVSEYDISRIYNAIALKGSCIVHYIGDKKPWNGTRCPLKNVYLKYLLMTPYWYKAIPVVLKQLYLQLSILRKKAIQLRFGHKESYIIFCGITLYKKSKQINL